jgi:hypothetical protein
LKDVEMAGEKKGMFVSTVVAAIETTPYGKQKKMSFAAQIWRERDPALV